MLFFASKLASRSLSLSIFFDLLSLLFSAVDLLWLVALSSNAEKR
jgi:hypothetical protein